jgi:hypothetical protein
MANRYAVATGNWSNTATWDGGTLPQAGDDVRPNGFTVTIDQDVTVTALKGNASSPAVLGGSFVITSPTTRTLNCNIDATGCNGIFFRLQSTGIVNITGNITYSGNITGITSTCINIEANCTVNHTGNATGGGNTIGYGSSHSTIRIVSTCIFNGTGVYTGGNYDGTGGATNSAIEVANVGSPVPIITLVGSMLAGIGLFSPAISIRNSNSTVIINGIIQATSTSPAIYAIPSLTTIALTTLRVSGSIINTSGTNAINSPRLILTNANSVSYLCQTENALVNKTLYSADLLTGYPLVANVETGTVYGPSSEFTGTLNPVTVNVTVDTNAIAAAISTSLEASLPPLLAPPLATDLLAEISTSADPLAERLRNASTVQSTGAQLQSLVIAP